MSLSVGSELKEFFQAEGVTANGERLVLRYRFSYPKPEASYTVKNCWGVVIPKRDYKEVIFIENGIIIWVLNMAKGKWSVPEMSNENASPNRLNAGNGK